MWAWINSVGIVCVVGGTILLFRFGLPFEEVRPSGADTVVITTVDSPRQSKRAEFLRRMGWLALGLIVFGSILQIAVSFATL